MDSAAESIIFIIGAPGSGKGTLCKRLAEEYGFSHLSVGDLLRDVTSSSNTDVTIIDTVKSGELVPVEVLAPMLKGRVDKGKEDGQMKILLDGFPRRLDQAAPVERLLRSPTLVLFFDCPEQIAEKRFLTRMLTGREADDEQTFRKRYQEFSRLNPSIVEHYRTRGIVLEIDTSGETEVSYQRLISALKGTGAWRSLAALM
ncbi:P-loop containing nucleoside triphosphate hydrolase protein [Melanomma pulvis-pyrius CBS 109.77]|uniref:P-loop containing nucleoside triphosphate hydrolase protein n=1 Tax=Melanomma pulvis-pyrius CBS 109.77 TaxID=1314802 RepID=A0A6A6X0I1_9PLEO|nr:P-loop containing nucleoside triphosphate hydrolase protein [Melanomma pulvis-pyrius CBS 109.77]